MAFLSFIIALIVCITIHEFSHALTAHLLGDPTPKHQGRLSLNPIRHMDPLGTIALFIFHIGWGKPVQINDRNFKSPIRDSAITSIAGPISNFLTAFLIALPIKYVEIVHTNEILSSIFYAIFSLSIVLGIFNLIPLPPFDGSKVLALIIPDRYQYQYQIFMERGIIYVLLLLLFDSYILSNILGFSITGRFIDVFYTVISGFILSNT